MNRNPGVSGSVSPLIPIDEAHPLSSSVLKRLLSHLNDKILAIYFGIKNKASSSNIKLKPVAYATQLFSGANYYVKMAVIRNDQPPTEYIRVVINYQPWTSTERVTSVEVL